MALSEKDRNVLWSAVYTTVMTYEHGDISRDEAMDVIEVICTGTAAMPDPDEK